MTIKDIILVTGQSGIKIEYCINKLREGNPFVSIDKEMPKVSHKNFKKEILSEPPYIQEKIWSDAFDSIVGKGQLSEVKKDQYYFLTFHATYFHQRNKEFLSPINFKKLEYYADRIKMIIVLVDDCYDIYRRLLGKGEMYHHVIEEETEGAKEKEAKKPLSPLEALIESIMNIFSILSWREMEIAFSRQIAHCLGDIPCYIVSVKHPAYVISRIIRKPSRELNIAYLAHSITDIRDSYDFEFSDFYIYLGEFIRKKWIQENFALFVPDTIDEKRIKKEKMGNNSYKYIPELLDRWILPSRGDWLFAPITDTYLKEIEPLNPKKFKFFEAVEETKSMISSMLTLLVNKISSQINSRDHALVELGKLIVLYRPHYCGTIPPGVFEEITYHHQLKTKYNQINRRAFCISAEEDIGKLNIKIFFRQIFYIILDKTTENKLKSLEQSWLNNSQKKHDFFTRGWQKEDIRKSIEDVIPKEYKFKTPYIPRKRESTLGGASIYTQEEDLNKCWEKVFGEIPESIPLIKYFSGSTDKYLCFPEKDLHEEIEKLFSEI